MRWEEIRDRVALFNPESMNDRLNRDLILIDLDAAIAERAMPVTEESLTKRFGRPKKHLGDTTWLFSEKVFVQKESTRFVVRKSSGHFVDVVENLGQLLDILSGLGVRT